MTKLQKRQLQDAKKLIEQAVDIILDVAVKVSSEDTCTQDLIYIKDLADRADDASAELNGFFMALLD